MFFRKKNLIIESIDQAASAILYPNKIIIETRNKEGQGSWYSTDNVVLLPIDVSDGELGLAIFKHLAASVFKKISLEERKKIRESYRKKLKFKTEKALVAEARVVSIKRDNIHITINPYKNKRSDKTFFGQPSLITQCPFNCNHETLGKEIRDAWKKCEFI